MRSDGRQSGLRHAQACGARSAMRTVRLALSTMAAIVGLMLLPALAGALPAPTPLNTSAPALTGTPVPGQTLTCSTGTWANSPSANSPSGYTYAWLRDGSPISGQSAGTYVVQSADSGHSISCLVTAINVGGEYTIVGLPSGSYTISFGTGTEGTLNYLPQYYSNQSSLSAATAVAVTSPNAVGNIDAALQAGGEIGGKVTAAVGGAALAKVEVCAISEAFGKCTTTNAAGEYTIVGLRSGSYTVTSFKEGFFESEGNYAPQSQAGIVVTAPNTTGDVNLQLPPGGQIAGQVIDSGHSAVAGVIVCAFGESFDCAFTNASGEYVISGLASGSYQIAFIPGTEALFGGSDNGNYLAQYYNGKSSEAEAEEVLVIAPGVLSKIDAELQPGGEISGVVKDAGTHAPLAGAEVCASAGTEGFEGNCASTNGSGEYTIVGLPTNTNPAYTVEFFAPEGGNYLTFSVPGVSVTAPENTEHVNAELQAGGQITGMATDASSHARLANVRVCANNGESTRCTSTNATGEYSIAALSSGSYRVGFAAPQGQNYAPQTLAGVSVVAPSTTPSVNAAMQAGAEISGRVTDAVSMVGIAGVEVCAFGASGFAECATTNGLGGSASATSAALGVPRPDSRFHRLKKPRLDKGNLDFFFHVANPGAFNWRLSFRSSCKVRRHRHGCPHSVRFGSGSQAVAGAGTVEIKVHASARALKALRAGRVLRVSGKFTFQSTFGGAPMSHTQSAVVRMHKKKGKHRRK
jgi:carboxypeptidase family protein